MSDDSTTDALAPEDCVHSSPNPSCDCRLRTLSPVLQDYGIRSIFVRYAGSGDSGSVEEVILSPSEVSLSKDVEDRLIQIAEDYCPEGYENNAGGHGTLTLYLEDGLARLVHYDSFEDSEDTGTRDARLPARLRRTLRSLGVNRVSAHLDGYGDSGQIEDLHVEPQGATLDEKLAQALEEFLLKRLPGGWENNDGSYGDFTVDVATGRVHAEAYWRITADSEPQVTAWKWRS